MLKVSLSDILQDRKSGSSALYKQALNLFLSDERFHTIRSLKAASKKLLKSFPAMAVFSYLDRNLTDLDSAKSIKAQLRRLHEEAKNEIELVGQNLDIKWTGKRRIVTFSQSTVVRQVLLGRIDKIKKVLISCASPGNEGIVAARKLARKGIEVQLVADASLPAMVEKKDYILLGADAVSRDYFVNKSGSLPLLLAAREAGAISFILFERFKYTASPDLVSDRRPHPATEIMQGRVKNIQVINKYFEKINNKYADWFVSGARISPK